MELLTLVMIALVLAFVYVVISTAYDIGKRHGHRDCEPDSERADRYRDAVDALDKWCGHESPHARLIAAHLLAVGEGLAMNAGTPCGDEPCTISGMREQLRRLPPNAKSQATDAALSRRVRLNDGFGGTLRREEITMATMTVAKLHKLLGEMVDTGNGRRPVCVNKASFFHPLESDGVAILDVTEAKAETITMADDDGWTATNKDGSEKTRKVFVLGGGHRLDEVTPNAELRGSPASSASPATAPGSAARVTTDENMKATKPKKKCRTCGGFCGKRPGEKCRHGANAAKQQADELWAAVTGTRK